MSKDEPIGTYDPRNQLTVGALLRYAQHKARCEWLQPMWHKGPCDCGFKELILSLPEDLLKLLVETNDHVRATIEDMKVQQEERNDRKAPKKYRCSRCPVLLDDAELCAVHPTAPRIQTQRRDPCGHNDDGTDYG